MAPRKRKTKRRRSVWGAIGAVLGGVGVEVGQVAIDVATGAGAGALKAVMEGRFDKASIVTGAITGAAIGVAARYGLDRMRQAEVEESVEPKEGE